jgi:hypothetical protein
MKEVQFHSNKFKHRVFTFICFMVESAIRYVVLGATDIFFLLSSD